MAAHVQCCACVTPFGVRSAYSGAARPSTARRNTPFATSGTERHSAGAVGGTMRAWQLQSRGFPRIPMV